MLPPIRLVQPTTADTLRAVDSPTAGPPEPPRIHSVHSMPPQLVCSALSPPRITVAWGTR